jgi:hypothetical protein
MRYRQYSTLLPLVELDYNYLLRMSSFLPERSNEGATNGRLTIKPMEKPKSRINPMRLSKVDWCDLLSRPSRKGLLAGWESQSRRKLYASNQQSSTTVLLVTIEALGAFDLIPAQQLLSNLCRVP